MRCLLGSILLVSLFGVLGFAAKQPVAEFFQRRTRPQFDDTEITSGEIRLTVTASGRVEPKLRVQIGAFVSGPIEELRVDFNDEVEAGEVLLKIDPAIYLAAVRRDEAALATANADVRRVKALLQQAINDQRRGLLLHAENDDFITDAELDRLKFNKESLEAQLQLANASVERGNFGSPCFFVDDEMFYGKETLWEVEEAINAKR